MAEIKKTAVPEAPPTAPLARASESGDPTVHKAMGDLQTAQMNRAALDVAAADIKAADEAVEAAKKNLAELGYE